MKRLTLIGCLLLACVFTTSSQDTIEPKANVVVPSTEVAAVNKFIDVPIDYYTGTSNVSIPLVNLEFERFSVPINVRYHSQGIKVTEHASWVGMNWAITGLGTISRTARGLPDEYNYGKKGFFHNTRLLYSNGQPNQSIMLDCPTTTIVGPPTYPRTVYDSLAQGYLDLEPDLYHISSPLVSNKFVFDHNRNPHFLDASDAVVDTHPYTSLLSSNPFSDDPADYYSWKIINETGIEMEFSNPEFTNTTTICEDNLDSYDVDNIQSAWHISKITDGSDWVEFTYTSATIDYDRELSQSGKYLIDGVEPHSNPVTSCDTDTNYRTKYLSQIETSNGYKVVFYVSSRTDLTGAKKLDSIKLYQNDKFVKSHHFTYSYYSGGGKLRLDKIEQKDAQGDVLHENSFEYYTGNIPAHDSRSIDNWGFYNGSSNTNLIPPFRNKYYFSGGGADRDPDLASTKIGALKKWTVPTGGHLLFDYELNKHHDTDALVYHEYELIINNGETKSLSFTVDQLTGAAILQTTYVDDSLTTPTSYLGLRDSVTQQDYTLIAQAGGMLDKIEPGTYELYGQSGFTNPIFIKIMFMQEEATDKETGGLRVSSVKYYEDDLNLVRTTTMEYQVENGNSSGKLFSEPVYGGYTSSYLFGVLGTLTCFDEGLNSYLHVTSQPQTMSYSGSHIGYDVVKVSNVSASGGESSGSTLYEYVNIAHALSGGDFPQVYYTLDMKNGKPLKTTFLNDQDQKLRIVTNSYSEVGFDPIYSFAVRKHYDRFCYECQQSDFITATSNLGTRWYRLEQVEERSIFGNSEVVQTRTIGYSASHYQVASEKVDESDSDQQIFTSFGRNSTYPGLVESAHQRLASKQSGLEIASSTIRKTDYAYDANHRLITQTDYDRITDVSRVAQSIERYADGTIKSITGADSLTSTFIWSYQIDNDHTPMKLVAKLDNITPAQVDGLLFSVQCNSCVSMSVLKGYTLNDSTTLYNVLDELADVVNNPDTQTVQNNPNVEFGQVQMTIFKYDTGDKFAFGMNGMIDPNGRETKYVYDSFGRLVETKEKNGNDYEVIQKVEYKQRSN